MQRGFYPEIYQTDLPPAFFYSNYLGTYLERDVTHLIKGTNMRDFRRLMTWCAGLVGQTLNYATAAKQLQLSVPTVKRWLHYLEQSYIIFLVGPYFNNFGKRLVKTPKLYFTDTGLALHLLDLDSPRAVRKSTQYGAFFENLIVAELYKQRYHAGNTRPLYYYRDSNQLEVDLLEQRGDTVTLTEIKATTSYHSRLSTNLNKVASLLPVGSTAHKRCIYGGTDQVTISGTEFIPWQQVGRRS